MNVIYMRVIYFWYYHKYEYVLKYFLLLKID